ncbi:hypothetical protein C408_4559 [Vibrio diabolicus E0666]|nr:hypothetical protein C408_4559 [Vibrio diabolicus E0666]
MRVFKLLLLGCSGARAFSGPEFRRCILLTKSGFILKPDIDTL